MNTTVVTTRAVTIEASLSLPNLKPTATPHIIETLATKMIRPTLCPNIIIPLM